jgi:hypothetical protein
MMVVPFILSDITNGPRPCAFQFYTTGEVYVINCGAAGITGGVNSVVWMDGINYLAGN